MATWRTISAGEVDTGSPVTDVLASAWANNPGAIAAGASGAPVAESGWHPYNMVTYGDGNDGAFYDFAIHGAVTTFDTPNFENGFEYRIIMEGMNSTLSRTPTLAFGIQADGTYSTAYTAGALFGGEYFLDVTIILPRKRMTAHLLQGVALRSPTVENIAGGAAHTDSKIQRVRIDSLGPSTGGKMYLLKRSNPLST